MAENKKSNEKRLIDANALDNQLSELMIRFHTMGRDKVVEDYNFVRTVLETAPTVDAVEVVHGRWIHCKGKSNLWYCSECGEKILYNPTRRTYNIEKRPVHEVNKYCRCCGTKMDGGNENGICKKG